MRARPPSRTFPHVREGKRVVTGRALVPCPLLPSVFRSLNSGRTIPPRIGVGDSCGVVQLRKSPLLPRRCGRSPPPEGCLDLREGNRIVKEQVRRPDATCVGYALAGRLRGSLEQEAPSPPAGHGALQIPDYRFQISIRNPQSPIRDSSCRASPSPAGQRVGHVRGLEPCLPFERRSYHGTMPHLRAGQSPVRSPSSSLTAQWRRGLGTSKDIGPIGPIGRIGPGEVAFLPVLSALSLPSYPEHRQPNTEHPLHLPLHPV